jgi:cyclic pyranopterin monophosphate synthase
MPTAPEPAADAAGSRLSHVGPEGVRMVDVGDKAPTARTAVASGRVRMSEATLDLLARGAGPKGDVFTTAQVAGVQGAKHAWEWIPMAHPLALSHCSVRLWLEPDAVAIEATCRTTGPTGVEMEALTAVSAAALTVYDMLKAVERGMVIEAVRLERKEGGRSGLWQRTDAT